MARPGFVLEVDERTPPLLVRSGADIIRERFPLGTRVVYPADPVPPLEDLDDAIERALSDPHGAAPLAERLKPGMKLTLTVSDGSGPLPRMRRPDIRTQLAEHVLTLAAAAGVDDVQVIAATGLRRRLTDDELEWILGERVVRSFAGDRLASHDAEDRDNLVSVGHTEGGVEVEINRRVVESDLVVHLGAQTAVAQPGGWDGVLTGLGSATTLAARFGTARSEHRADLAAVLAERVPVFAVEAALNTDMYPSPAQLLGRREWEWSVRDQATFVALRRALAFTPHRARQVLFTTPAPYGVIAVAAGDPEQAHAQVATSLAAQHRVEVSGQTDVLITGVGQLSRHGVGASLNPLVAAATAAEAYGRHVGDQPLVRAGGAMIIYHPATAGTSGREQPSTPDFLTDVLSVTTDPARIAAEFEPRFAADPWYRHLYRDANAYHALQPLHLWYSLTRMREELSDVVWVGADRASVEQLGFRAASTLADALEMVSTQVGRSPSLGYLHTPPYPLVDVR